MSLYTIARQECRTSSKALRTWRARALPQPRSRLFSFPRKRTSPLVQSTYLPIFFFFLPLTTHLFFPEILRVTTLENFRGRWRKKKNARRLALSSRLFPRCAADSPPPPPPPFYILYRYACTYRVEKKNVSRGELEDEILAAQKKKRRETTRREPAW